MKKLNIAAICLLILVLNACTAMPFALQARNVALGIASSSADAEKTPAPPSPSPTASPEASPSPSPAATPTPEATATEPEPTLTPQPGGIPEQSPVAPPVSEQSPTEIVMGGPLSTKDFALEFEGKAVDLLTMSTSDLETILGGHFSYSQKPDEYGIYRGTMKTSLGTFQTGYEQGYPFAVELASGVATARGVKKGDNIDKARQAYGKPDYEEDKGNYHICIFQTKYPQTAENYDLKQARPVYFYGIVFVSSANAGKITNIHIMDTVQEG